MRGATRARGALLLLLALGGGHAFTLLHSAVVPEPTVTGILNDARRWTAPSSPGGSEGLGGGLTYALDRQLCAQMLPRFTAENYEAAVLSLDPLLITRHTACSISS
ncbi:hypothetical protein T492DRAFT_891703 [Pavlovales sp. CCMP2436]|nr:hypothetical protein T492DRAFT_891703 [Pavlovales sp. CCMP2436]